VSLSNHGSQMKLATAFDYSEFAAQSGTSDSKVTVALMSLGALLHNYSRRSSVEKANGKVIAVRVYTGCLAMEKLSLN